MRLKEAKKLLKKYCDHYEEWRCGKSHIFTTERNKNGRFDRRIEIYLDLKPYSVEIKKIKSLLKLLDRLGKNIKLFSYKKQHT